MRALARSTRPETIDLSRASEAAEPLLAEIAGQAAWNISTATRMHQIAHRLERFGELLFLAVLALAVGWL